MILESCQAVYSEILGETVDSISHGDCFMAETKPVSRFEESVEFELVERKMKLIPERRKMQVNL